MFISTEFEFANEKGMDYGLMLGRIESGMIEQVFGYNRTLVYEKIPNVPTPIYYHQEHQPLAFRITLIRKDTWSDDDRLNIVKWLFRKDFQDFRSMDNPSICYKIMFVDDNRKFDNANNEGYIELNAISLLPYPVSPITEYTYDFSGITSEEDFIVVNPSNLIDEYYYPEIQVELTGGNTDFEIVNMTDGNRSFKFEGLSPNEKIYVDNKNAIIMSDVPNVYRLNNFVNRTWFRLVSGKNYLKINGECVLKIRGQYPMVL